MAALPPLPSRPACLLPLLSAPRQAAAHARRLELARRRPRAPRRAQLQAAGVGRLLRLPPHPGRPGRAVYRLREGAPLKSMASTLNRGRLRWWRSSPGSDRLPACLPACLFLPACPFACHQGAGKTLLLMLHGGGHSALSWAAFARDICSRCAVRAVAFDQRGHGTTAVADEQGGLQFLAQWLLCRTTWAAGMPFSALACVSLSIAPRHRLVPGHAD